MKMILTDKTCVLAELKKSFCASTSTIKTSTVRDTHRTLLVFHTIAAQKLSWKDEEKVAEWNTTRSCCWWNCSIAVCLFSSSFLGTMCGTQIFAPTWTSLEILFLCLTMDQSMQAKVFQLTWQANSFVEHHVERWTFTDSLERAITSFEVVWAVHVVMALDAQRHNLVLLLHCWCYRHRHDLRNKRNFHQFKLLFMHRWAKLNEPTSDRFNERHESSSTKNASSSWWDFLARKLLIEVFFAAKSIHCQRSIIKKINRDCTSQQSPLTLP